MSVHPPDAETPVLSIRNLTTTFTTPRGTVRAVNNVSYDLKAGELLGVVGESGCGKSVTALSVMNLIPASTGRVEGSVRLKARELVGLAPAEMRRIRGNEISMIFQEPMTSLNPVMRIGVQIAEPIVLHQGMSWKDAKRRAIEMLDLVRIPDARRVAGGYPHEISGGMRQRVMIATALACRPSVLFADEPTTALDVTVQSQVLRLIQEIREELGTGIVLITHDLGVIAEAVDRVVVMYAGRKIEEAPVNSLFRFPRHPYTVGLLGSVTRLSRDSKQDRRRLVEIPGIVPLQSGALEGCQFAPRCRLATQRCQVEEPPLTLQGTAHHAACWHSDRAHEVNYA